MSTTMTPPPPPPPSAAAPRPNPASDSAAKPWYKRDFYVGRAVKIEEVMNFSRQLSSFLRAGVPILDSLGVVAEENASKKMQEVVADMQRRLQAGSSFGDAIAAQNNVFPGYFISVVRAAELTGQLDDALEQLSGYLEREAAARRELKSSLTYPCIVFVLAIFAVVIMSAYVLPKFKSFYTDLGAHLPLPTRMLLGFTNFMTQWWLVIVGVIAVVVAIGFVVIGGAHGKARRDALVLRLPAIGALVKLAAIERFCRVLGALVHTGVSLPDAVQVAADSTNNRVFQGKLAAVREAMMRGEGLARPIAAAGLFPPAARQMIRVGESTGSLDAQLHNAALFYERELSYRLKRFTDMFEPAIILIVGGMVAFVAIAQISAMYSVYHQVKI
jgi:type IV pilus assembly protein PilC